MKRMMKKAVAILSIASCVLATTAIGTVAAEEDSKEIRIECESAEYTATKASGGSLAMNKTANVTNKDGSVHGCIIFSYSGSIANSRVEMGDKIEYTVDVETAGAYTLDIAYRLNDNYYSTVQVSVNGTAVGTPVSTAGDVAVVSDDNQVVQTAVGEAEFAKGVNTVTFEIVGLAAKADNTQLVLDYINLTPVPTEESGEIRLECETAEYTGTYADGTAWTMSKTANVVNKDQSTHACAVFSNAKAVAGSKLEYTVEVTTAGTYSLEFAFRYNETYHATVQVQVNGADLGDPVSMRSQDANPDHVVGSSPDNQVVSVNVGKVALTEGENTVTFVVVEPTAKPTTPTVVLDYISLMPAEADPPATEGDPIDPPATEGDPTDPPATEGDPTDPPATEGDPTDPPATEGDPTDPPATEGDPTDPPASEDEPTVDVPDVSGTIRVECEEKPYDATFADGSKWDMSKTATVTNQDGGKYTCAVFSDAKAGVGSKIQYTLNLAADGYYSLDFAFRYNENYHATVQVQVNGVNVGAPISMRSQDARPDHVVGKSPDNQVVTVNVGKVELKAGENTVTFVIVESEAKPTTHTVVLDSITLSAAEIDEPVIPDSPATGDTAVLSAVLAGGVAAIAAATLITVSKKRKIAE